MRGREGVYICIQLTNTQRQRLGQGLEGELARRDSETGVGWRGFPGEQSCAGPAGKVGPSQAEGGEVEELAIPAGSPEQGNTIASDGLTGHLFEVSIADLQNEEVAFRKVKLITENVQLGAHFR